MNKKKRLLSLVTALTITATAFSGFAVSVNAADDGTVHYTQDYETATEPDWKTGTSGRYTPILATETSGNKYLTVDQSSRNNNGATLTSATISSDAAGGRYAVEFDAKLGSSNNQNNTTLNINTDDGYLFSIKENDKNTTSWKINGSIDVTLPGTSTNTDETMTGLESMPWYHFTVAYGAGATYVTINDSDGTEILPQTLVVSGTKTGSLKNMTFATSRYYAELAIDNVVIRNLNENEIPDIKFYTAKINTTRYATMTQADGTVLYADVNGYIEIPLLTSGTEIDYTLSKTGYEDLTDKIEITDADVTKDTPLTLKQEGVEEKTIYFESDFGNANSAYVTTFADRLTTMGLGTIELPAMATFSMDVTVDKAEETHFTWILQNSDGKDIVGLQGTADGLAAFTGFNGSATSNSDVNQSGAVGAYTNGAKIADTYIGTYSVSFVIDSTNKAVTVKCGDATVSLPLIEDASTIKSMKVGKYRNNSTVTIDNVTITEPNPNYVNISGDTEFAKIAGKTVTRTYKASPAVMIPGEVFTWTVKDENGADVAGVTIDENGVLSVEDTAVPAKVTVSAVSDASDEKKGTIDVTIRDFATVTPTIVGAKAVSIGDSVKYEVTKIVDEYGDDVTEYFTPVWSIDGVPSTDCKVAFDVTGKSGDAVVLKVKYDGNGALDSLSADNIVIAEGDTTLSVDAEEGEVVMLWNSLGGMEPLSVLKVAEPVEIPDTAIAAVSAKNGILKGLKSGDVSLKVSIAGADTEYAVKVGEFSVVEDYTDGMTTVDVSNIVADNSITGYQVTVADADGKLLSQQVVQAENNAVAVPAVTEGTPAKVEAAPVYEGAIGDEFLVPDAAYNVTVTANNGRRTDVYVNDQMMFNNINQSGDNWTIGRIIADSTDYTASDVVIAEGYAKFNLRDDQSGGTTITAVKFVKAPSIVNRAKRIYIIGDSLVANYYGTAPEGSEALVRTGWGQVFADYAADGVEVTNLGNSGAWAAGMVGDAFTNVIYSAQPGDIVVWESGYNDKKNGGVAPMKEAITKAINKCNEMGIEIYLVTPNASSHDYNNSVVLSSDIRDLGAETNTPVIDLAAKSYAFLSAKYGTETDAHTTLQAIYNNTADTLHSSYNAANCWASIVAQGLYDAGKTEYVNTEHSYTFNDGTNDITVKVEAAASTTPAE